MPKCEKCGKKDKDDYYLNGKCYKCSMKNAKKLQSDIEYNKMEEDDYLNGFGEMI